MYEDREGGKENNDRRHYPHNERTRPRDTQPRCRGLESALNELPPQSKRQLPNDSTPARPVAPAPTPDPPPSPKWPTILGWIPTKIDCPSEREEFHYCAGDRVGQVDGWACCELCEPLRRTRSRRRRIRRPRKRRKRPSRRGRPSVAESLQDAWSRRRRRDDVRASWRRGLDEKR